MENREGIANSLLNLGNAVHLQGDQAAAAVLQEEDFTIFWELREPGSIAECLKVFDSLARRVESGERAVRLWGAAALLQETLGALSSANDQVNYEREVAAACEALGDAAFQAAWEAGRALTGEKAPEYALEEAEVRGGFGDGSAGPTEFRARVPRSGPPRR